MSPPDFGAMLRWPDVPAVYDWLSLDRRGRWRLRGEPLAHHGVVAFFNRQYGCDEDGRYFVQNGPQRVFVALDYTPWVVRLAGAGADSLLAHTGVAVEAVGQAWLDEAGNLLLATPAGAALLDDRDLPAMLDRIEDADGTPAPDSALLALLAAPDEAHGRLTLRWAGKRLPLCAIRRADVARRFAFVARPAPLTE